MYPEGGEPFQAKLTASSSGPTRVSGFALPAVVLVSVWKNVGFSLVILLAGLQGLPQEVLEAARCDGASRRQLTLQVITPLMKPIIGIATVLSVIGGLKVFDLVYIMTRGGPTYSTEVFATMLYRHAFDLNEMGIASALALKDRGVAALVVDEAQQVAPRWQARYDRLRLNTSRPTSHLPGRPYPKATPMQPVA